MSKRWRRGLHMTVVSLLIGVLMVDTAAACKLFGRRSCRCFAPLVAGQCGIEKALSTDQEDPPVLEASPSDSLLTPKPEVDPPAAQPPAVVPVPAVPAEAVPPAAAPALDVEPIPATPAPTRAPPAPHVAPPPEPSAPAPRVPAPTPPAAESFDYLFPPATPAAPTAPASPEEPAPVPAPSPDEDDPFAPAAPTPAPVPAPAPAVDDDDPFAPAPAGNRTGRPAAPASPAPSSPAPAADPFANPFQTSAAGAFPVRAWSDDSGLFQIRGRLVTILDGKVRILKTTGRTTTVPLSRLSVADRQYVAAVVQSNEPAAPKVAAR